MHLGRRVRQHLMPRSRPLGLDGSKQVEIFTLFPLRYLRLEAGDLSLLDVREIVDEGRAQAVAKAGITAQRHQRLVQRLGQHLGLGLVGRVGRGPGASLRASPSSPASTCEAM